MNAEGKLSRLRLYALISEEHCRQGWLETAEELLAGGVDALQLREKSLSDGTFLQRARTLRKVTERFSALLIINDRPDVACLSEADGVHLGQEDLPPAEVRKLVGADFLIGLSTHSPEQAAGAVEKGADYVGVGPAYPTATKGYERGGGAEFVRNTCAATPLSTVAIGGITPGRVAELMEAGADAVAVCGALCGAEEPRKAAETFRRELEDFHAG